MTASLPAIFLCNGAKEPTGISKKSKVVTLSYLKNDPNRSVNLKLPSFIDQVYHLPPRLLDLLEIAAYVFAADRWTSRGPKEATEFHAWSRSMRFVIRVRDVRFWNRAEVKESLAAALTFMTGDHEYRFQFASGHTTPPASLFDREEFKIEKIRTASVVLFSGGLDSLAGALQRLQSTSDDIYLISHQSGQPSTKRTQKALFDAIVKEYPGRVFHYSFECGLSGTRAAEETQRTRAFLFGSIAFVLAQRISRPEFFAYENGVTSLNLLRRQDLINARASRTTHPKTHALMANFLSLVQGSKVQVLNPFWQHTKADVFQVLDKVGGRNLISSAISCSKTFHRLESGTHCGACFQCIDRRLAGYASGLQTIDNAGIYSKEIFTETIDSPEARTTALDYIRQATTFATTTDDQFATERLNEFADIVDYVEAKGEQDAVEKIWTLCHRHGEQVIAAIKAIRNQHDNPCVENKPNSLLKLIADREYLKENAERLSAKITDILNTAIPIAFKTRRPAKEDELNDQIDALLRTNGQDFRREFPLTMFALAKVIPDHEVLNADLLIEAKYIREGTPPSKITDGIAADITKYSAAKFILFVVYDPDRKIADDVAFIRDIENKRACSVSVIR